MNPLSPEGRSINEDDSGRSKGKRKSDVKTKYYLNSLSSCGWGWIVLRSKESPHGWVAVAVVPAAPSTVSAVASLVPAVHHAPHEEVVVVVISSSGASLKS
jgi:hypothetical protein